MKLSGNIDALTPTPDSKGYWLSSTTGGVYTFGDARSYGAERTSGIVAAATT